MAKIYAALIRKGLRVLEQVPPALREAVAALLSTPDASTGEATV